MPATNKKVTIDVMDIVYFRGDKIAAHWALVDIQNMLMQLTGR